MEYVDSNSIVLQRQGKSAATVRPCWVYFKRQNPGYTIKDKDSAYKHFAKSKLNVQSLCEIGSDMGRSTAWLSNIAQNIDVYEQDTSYIELCKQQCYRQQKQYGPIRNVNWKNTDNISITQVLETLPKQYDAIKLANRNIKQYIPLLLKKLKPNGVLLLKEYRDKLEKEELVQMLQKEYNMDLTRHDLQIFVAKHK